MSAILDIALSGLRASQIAIDTTAHNVANASVEGYSRQRAIVATQNSQVTSKGFLGGGVVVADAERITNRWTERHLNTELTQSGYYSELTERLSQVEAIFNETSTPGIADAMNGFFEAASSVSDNPESIGDRVAFGQAAQQLASRITNADAQLVTALTDTRVGAEQEAVNVNQKLDEVAQLNGLIMGMVQNNRSASDMQDRRDLLLRDLSELTGGSSYITEDGSEASFSINGVALVLGSGARHIDFGGTGFVLEDTGQPLTIDKGKLGALNEVVKTGGVIDDYRTQLNTLASSFITQMNVMHTAGYGLDGIAGRALFTGTGATDMAVSTTMLDNPRQIAASADGTTGNNGITKSMLNMRRTGYIAGQTWDDYYQSIVGGIGGQTLTATSQQTSLSSVVSELKNRVDEVRGVSLDEEMANLIQFQQVYNASSRLVQTVKDMTDAVLTLGR
ncbi:MAG: flagellar hook-associated protein FlgK [Armatimonadetes bacterium]|nr:flagellar hook-associated protein FlgK [Armatimonadota bacterium]